MSEKRSWDIQPKRKVAPPAPPSPTLKIARPMVRPLRSRPAPAAPLARGERLRSRRQAARKRLRVVFIVLFVILCGALFSMLWQPFDRIQTVTASGIHADAIPAVAASALTGTYYYVIPRNSVFFYPKEAVRSSILNEYPDIAAVSLTRTSFSSIEADVIPRAVSFTWCGASQTEPSPDGNCYDADADGFLFEQYVASSTSASSTLPVLPVYAPLAASSTDLLRATVGNPGGAMGVIRFARAMGSLGARVVAVQIRGDEADLFTTHGTRITYVIGQESAAASLAATAFPTLDLNGGSLDYIDLRFSGKVYYKAKGAQ